MGEFTYHRYPDGEEPRYVLCVQHVDTRVINSLQSDALLQISSVAMSLSTCAVDRAVGQDAMGGEQLSMDVGDASTMLSWRERPR